MKPGDNKSNPENYPDYTFDPARFPEILTEIARLLRESGNEELAKKADKAKGNKSLSDVINAVTDGDLHQTLLKSTNEYGPDNHYTGRAKE